MRDQNIMSLPWAMEIGMVSLDDNQLNQDVIRMTRSVNSRHSTGTIRGSMTRIRDLID